MWSIPVLLFVLLAGAQLLRVVRSMHVDELDREAAWLVRDHRLQQLAARLAQAPAVVRWSRSTQLTNRIVLDIGGEEIEARCYHTPARQISVVTKLFYRPSVGWIIGIDGPNGPATLAAWLIDVHPVRTAR
jgi:hypothetical protein